MIRVKILFHSGACLVCGEISEIVLYVRGNIDFEDDRFRVSDRVKNICIFLGANMLNCKVSAENV